MLFRFLTVVLGTALFVHPAWSQVTSPHNFLPGCYPLAVRSPYLNSWLNLPNATANPNSWPTHWDTKAILGWAGIVRVDGKLFVWQGATGVGNGTVLKSAEVTPTRTIFTIVADTVSLKVTYLSPIEPANLVLQSLPFSYVAVEVSSNDGNQHSVQLYSDISGEWASGDRSNAAVWSTTQSAKSIFHQISRKSPGVMQEKNGQAEDATVYFAMELRGGLTWQTGSDADVRNQFVQAGALTGTQDTAFRAIGDRFPVLGISVDLGSISATPSSVVWALGLVRDPVVQYMTQTGTEERSSYFQTQFSKINDAIDFFVSDFVEAAKRATTLDEKILAAAQGVSDKYADLVSLGLRQTLAGIDFTVSKNPKGGWNQNDIKAFMKDTGSSGQVNAIETVYAAFPALLFLNATLAGYLLEPLLAYQTSSLYGNDFAAANLGAGYPLALGNNAGESVHAVEASGNMLAMVWAHATFSGKGQLIADYYDLLKKWAEYLVANAMNPAGQSLDGLTKPKMTNLVLQGILGIRAMSSISAAAGRQDDADKYMTTATSYIKEWANSASSSDHLSSTLDPTSPPSLIYNLFTERMLNFKLVDDSLIEKQSRFYVSQSQSAPKFGLPVDSNVQFAKSHWTAFTAAASNVNARDALISMIYSRSSVDTFPSAFSSVYNVESGIPVSGFASPMQGGLFSVLAINLPPQKLSIPPKSVNSPSVPDSSAKKKVPAGTIAGGVIGGIVALFLIAFIIFKIRRRRLPKEYTIEAPTPFVSARPVHQSQPSTSSYPEPRPLPVLPPPPEPVQAATSPSFSSPASSASKDALAETTQLRNEVAGLRREMAELRAQTEYEPLPGYQ